MRITLLHALVLFAVAGMSLAALVSGHPVWPQILYFLSAAALVVSALAALAWEGDPRRWFAIGFFLVGAPAFWSANNKGEALRRLPLLDATVEFFVERHRNHTGTPLDNGDVVLLTQTGRVMVRSPNGTLSYLRQGEVESLGYPVTSLPTYHGRGEFQAIAFYVATLLLAYLGGVAGMLVRRARRNPGNQAAE